MAIFQLAAAMNGFLLRGGITIGNLVHDDEVVFGPGLNRAYELESKIAKMPRFILDECVTKRFDLGDLPVVEDGLCFLDPFRLEYCRWLQNSPGEVTGAAEAGLPVLTRRMSTVEPLDIMERVMERLKPQIRAPASDAIYEKLAWLFDRVAIQLGRPRSASYPRA